MKNKKRQKKAWPHIETEKKRRLNLDYYPNQT